MKKDPYEYPCLRPVEPYLDQHQGQRMISLRDPTGLSMHGLSLSPPAFAMIL